MKHQDHGEELAEIFETVHMTLFLVMVIYLMQVRSAPRLPARRRTSLLAGGVLSFVRTVELVFSTERGGVGQMPERLALKGTGTEPNCASTVANRKFDRVSWTGGARPPQDVPV